MSESGEQSPPPPAKPCPICGRPAQPSFSPFCSKRCADVDLQRWLGGVYAIPGEEGEDRPDGRSDGDPPGRG